MEDGSPGRRAARRSRARRLLFLALLGAAACQRPATAPSKAPPLVVLSLDGLKPGYVLDADALGLKLPELHRMRREGTFARVRGVLPTVTYPSHTTMMTGVRPKTHGIYANTTFDPLGQNRGGWYWYAEDIKVPTLYQAVEDSGQPAASLFWPVNVGAKARYVIPEVWRADTPDDRKLTRALAQPPGLVEGLERDLGELPGGHFWNIDSDRIRARFASRVITTKKPHFSTLHLLALDSAQHGRGPDQPEAYAVLEELDAVVASVRSAAEGANVCVVSDHGFQAVHTRVSVQRALADAKLLDHEGPFIRAWRATTWSSSGSGAVMLRDPDDKATVDEVRRLLADLAAKPELGIDRILERAEIEALGGFPNATFVIAMKPGFVLDDAVEAPLSAPLTAPYGAHGYLPTDPAMLATFLCAGPSVPPGRDLGTIDMIDLAPSFATLLRVRFPSAEGRSVF